MKRAQGDLNVMYNASKESQGNEVKNNNFEEDLELDQYVEIKIEEADDELNPAEYDHLKQIANSDTVSIDIVRLKSETNEENVFSEDVDPLTQQKTSAGSDNLQNATQNQMSLREFLSNCELPKSKNKCKKDKKIVKEISCPHNNVSVLYYDKTGNEFSMKIKSDTALKNEDEAINNLDLNNAANTRLSKYFEFVNPKFVDDNKATLSKMTTRKRAKKKYKQFISWDQYTWNCLHCDKAFSNMSDVRNHSKDVHKTCFGFKCADCLECCRTFNQFVEHVRDKHFECLRFFCQYCNRMFENPEQCVTHTFSHWEKTKICEYCGEVLANFEALKKHKQLYKKVAKASVAKRIPKVVSTTGSWDTYDWSCQDCWMKLPDVSSLRTHVRDLHNKCFAMRCVDCLMIMQNYVQFVSHVRKHRPYLQNYCEYCNMHFEEQPSLAAHIGNHCHICYACGQVFAHNIQLLHHIEQYNVHKVKGVPQDVHTNTTCNICHKTLLSTASLKKHILHLHKNKRKRDHICQTCGKAYECRSALQEHTYSHSDRTEKCKLCEKVFTSKRRLKIHAATHLEVETPFICDICGQSFRFKKRIHYHMLVHLDIKTHLCMYCHKTFRTKSHLKRHERQHTGARPYTCQMCNRTFTCWGNCNKHMIRKHGVTLAKTTRTARGRLDINRYTGEVNPIPTDENSQKWLKEITKSRKKRTSAF